MIGYEANMMQAATRAASRARVRVASLASCGLLLLGVAAPAQAEFGITPGSFKADALKADGTTPDTQAGGHPYQHVTTMRFNTVDAPGGAPLDPDENAKDIEVTLPRGFIGNPEAAAKCSRVDFDALVTTFASCPPASQVGVVELETLIEGAAGPFTVPLYNIEPKTGDTADFGLPVSVVAVHAVASIRTASDYKVVVKFSNISEAVPIVSAKVIFWGVPADPSHDVQRSCMFSGIITGSPCPAGLAPQPFLTNPSVCDEPLTTIAKVNSWQHPDVYKTE
ncbi:MAG: hypothetical protein ABUM26_04660, partial [Solirubrobacterales bacterium]